MVLLPVALGACASGGGGAGAGSDPDLLTREDLAPYLAQDVYQTIRRLRSNWLNARGAMGTPTLTTDPTTSMSRADDAGEVQIQVYIDGARSMTGLESLKDMSVEMVLEIRHMNGRDATTLYGTDHGYGAILVTTR
jgi:hypothetical protein